jgi:hypothetical protein
MSTLPAYSPNHRKAGVSPRRIGFENAASISGRRRADVLEASEAARLVSVNRRLQSRVDTDRAPDLPAFNHLAPYIRSGSFNRFYTSAGTARPILKHLGSKDTILAAGETNRRSRTFLRLEYPVFQ